MSEMHNFSSLALFCSVPYYSYPHELDLIRNSIGAGLTEGLAAHH